MTIWEDLLRDSETAALDELFELLRIPSVSTDPTRTDAVHSAAAWVVARLQRAGVPDVRLIEAGGHPAVIGVWDVDPLLPNVLIYGHYDVQPEDPVELWETPPFEPNVRDGWIFARGAADMKGSLLTAIHGVEASANANGGRPPINVRFIFEGEEEIGSPSFRKIVQQNRDLLKADAVLSADGGQFSDEQPSQTVARKGLTGLEITIRGANSDLHSGGFGAIAPNAARSAAQLAASFHDAEGRVAVAGFYDGVIELTDAERSEAAAVPWDEAQTKADLGLSDLWGEPGYTPQERIWARPTLDINGIWGGFQGEGSKTVTPSVAHIKLTCRLVPGQDPDQIVRLLQQHIRQHTPIGCTVDVSAKEEGARPYVLDRSDPVYLAVDEALTELYGRAPIAVRAGGTIPATAVFLEELGIHTIGYAWSGSSSRAHAPNERYQVESYLRGRRGYALLLAVMARRHAG